MKRGSDKRDAVDAGEFITHYFKERGMEDEATSGPGETIKERAEQARENFKRIRLEARGLAGSTDQMSAAEKYNRRLENNRNSAAASRVYREVAAKETAYTLREVAARAEKYEREATLLAQQVNEREREAEEMRQRIARLEAQVGTREASPSKIADAPTAFFDPPVVEVPIAAAPAPAPTQLPTHSVAPSLASLPPLSVAGSFPSLSIGSFPSQLGVSQNPVEENSQSKSEPQVVPSEQVADAHMRVATGELGDPDTAKNMRYTLDSQSCSAPPPVLSSQDAMKFETPESIDDDLPTLFSQSASIK